MSVQLTDRIMSYCSERRLKMKLKCVEYLGGKCIKCGYDKCINALEFHHRNPEEKSFMIAHALTSMYGVSGKWDTLKIELDKCDLICSNCHAELHFKDFQKTNENRILVIRQKAQFNGWPEMSELLKRLENSTYRRLASELGVSDNAIRKHLKVRGVDPKSIRSIKDNRFLRVVGL